MRNYIKPTLECIELRVEERLATCTKDGYCTVPDPYREVPYGQAVYFTLS